MNPAFPLSEDPILTVPQVAKYLQISRAKAYCMVSRKQLPHFRIQQNIRIRMSDLRKWLEHQINSSSSQVE